MQSILACRPVDTTELERAFPDLPVPKIYKNATIGKCESCKVEVYIGPRVRQMKDLLPESELVCMVCAAAIMIRERIKPEHIVQLGNTDTVDDS